MEMTHLKKIIVKSVSSLGDDDSWVAKTVL